MQHIKLDHFNTFMISMIILIFIIYYVMKYNEITENFSTYGYVACPPQFTKVGNTLHMYYNDGNIGIGNDNPVHKLDIRSGDTYIAIFKHTNNTQGIGIGYNSINALGSNGNQDININARGSGVVRCNGELQIKGANRTSHICYSNGNTYIRGGSTNGTVLLNDNGGDVYCGRNLSVNGFTNGVKIEQIFTVMIGSGGRNTWECGPSVHNKQSVTIRIYFNHKLYDVRSVGQTPATGPVTLSWFSEPISTENMPYWTNQGTNGGPIFWFMRMSGLPKSLLRIVVISYINDTVRNLHIL